MDGEIVIKIVSEGEGTTNIPSEPKEINEKDTNLIASALALYNQGKKYGAMILDVAEYQVNKQFNLKDDVESKRDIAVASSIVKKISNVALSIWAGAKIGGIGGGISAGLISVGGEILDAYKGYDQQDLNLKQQAKQLEYVRERAGYSTQGNSRGTNLWF